MQVRERRGYVRSFGQLSMTSLIQNMMSVANEEKRHDQGGVLIHRYVRILLDIRAAYRGITMTLLRLFLALCVVSQGVLASLTADAVVVSKSFSSLSRASVCF